MITSSDVIMIDLTMIGNYAASTGNDIYDSASTIECLGVCAAGEYGDCAFADANTNLECLINCASTCIPCSPGRASSVAGAGFNTTCEVTCLP